MKLIDPNKLIEELNKYPKEYPMPNNTFMTAPVMMNDLIQAIQASTKNYPYINNTEENIHNQNSNVN